MKQLFLTGLLVGSALFPVHAQSGYDDDIYSDRPAAPAPSSSGYGNNSGNNSGNSGNYNNNGYSNSGSGNGNYNSGNGNYNTGSYADDYDYIDYADDYSYSTRFRRFDAPFYNVNYWSGFWSPFSYDPFWGSPWYGGYSHGGWGRPGVYVSVGYGGPYWSSGWGYNTWYGYSGFSSYWGHGGGGYGYGSGYGAGYQNGYWDGYYAGLYGAGGGYSPYAYRKVNYAPRTAIGGVNGRSYRTPVSMENRGVNTSNQMRGGVLGGNRGVVDGQNISGNTPPVRAVPPAAGTRNNDRGTHTLDNGTNAEIRTPNDGRIRNSAEAPDRNIREATAPPVRSNNGRSDWFNNNNSNNDRMVEAPVRNNNPRGGRFEDGRTTNNAAEAPVRNNNGRNNGWMNNNNDRAVEAPVRETSRPRGGFFGNSDRNVQQAPVRNNDGWQNQRAPQPDRSYSAPQQQIERRQMPRFEQPQRVETPRSQSRFEAPAQRMSAPSGGSISAPSGGSRGGGGYRR